MTLRTSSWDNREGAAAGSGNAQSLPEPSSARRAPSPSMRGTPPLGGAGFFTRQRELFNRRLWPCALTFLGFMLYHVIGTATVLSATLQEAAAQHLSGAERAARLAGEMSGLFGETSVTPYLLTLPLAAVLAIEGFAWMDRRQEVDFYESQPVPRGQRFRDICVGSFLFYIFSYLLTMEAGLLIANAMGALTRAALVEALRQCLRSAAFFLAIYGLGVLSAMLTGNVVVAALAFLVLLLYENIFKLILRGCCSEFFATWTGRSQGLLLVNIFDPLYHYAYGIRAEGPLRLLALAALYFLLAWICYRLRRNECAGSAVVFGPVRSVVRIAMALITGLFAGLLFSSMQQSIGISLLWLVLFTVIAACIMQIIYEYDFRALFHRPLEIALASALALLVFSGFVFDIAGYDRFVPDPGKVSDAALIYTDGYGGRFDEDGASIDNVAFGEKYMHLENVEDVTALARFGQEYTRRRRALHGEAGTIEMEAEETGFPGAAVLTNDEPTYNFTVVYHMKNGKTAARSFSLPASIDPSMMDAVVGTPGYREGNFQICRDAFLRAAADSLLMDYTNGDDYATAKMNRRLYEDFRAAYLRDLEQFSYSFAHRNHPVGRITLNYDERRPADPGAILLLEDMTMYCPVYAEFTNTIAFLQENGLWLEPLDYDRITQLRDKPYEQLSKEEKALFDSLDDSVFDGPFSGYGGGYY